jgi:hypothetical protein
MLNKKKQRMSINWLETIRPYYLTLGEVRTWKRGHIEKVVTFDRNYMDALDHSINEHLIEFDVRYKALEFFRRVYKLDVYVHEKSASGKLVFGWQDNVDNTKRFSFDVLQNHM